MYYYPDQLYPQEKTKKKKKKRDSTASYRASSRHDKLQSHFDKFDPNSRRGRALRNVKKFAWTLVYPVLLHSEIEKRVLSRKKYESNEIDKIVQTALNNLLTFMMNISQDALVKLFDDKEVSYDYIGVIGSVSPE
mmetsp:Transcript_26800/g.23739  ORF Transcript_26800/g.23739 Transcript_26800/m.23739 type:complete len:135 (-) Transcript_26800:844-1248(-)